MRCVPIAISAILQTKAQKYLTITPPYFEGVSGTKTQESRKKLIGGYVRSISAFLKKRMRKFLTITPLRLVKK
jgi:hypothetical protein